MRCSEEGCNTTSFKFDTKTELARVRESFLGGNSIRQTFERILQNNTSHGFEPEPALASFHDVPDQSGSGNH